MNKLVFKNPSSPVEIFCEEKYKDYYIRGQAIELSDIVYFEKDKYAFAFYHLVVFVLVNDTYQEKITKDYECWEDTSPTFSAFVGKTTKEFLDMQNTYISGISKISEQSFKKESQMQELIKLCKEDTNPPVIIPKKEVTIIETAYLKDEIKSNQEIILLSMNLYLDRIESPETHSLVSHNNRIFTLPAYHFSDSDHYDPNTAGEFNKWFDSAYFNMDYNYLDKKEYFRILGSIGKLCWEWLEKQKISKEFLQSLNLFYHNISKREYPFTDFCYKFFDDLVADLIANKQIIQCQCCNNFFQYQENKKYCSFNCKKKAENDRFYKKHKTEIQPEAKKATRELRAFYKGKGIKK